MCGTIFVGTKWCAELFLLVQSDVRNYFCKSALLLRPICNSLTYDPALLHRRFIFVIILFLCPNGLYCNKPPPFPHLPLQTSKDYKTLGKAIFSVWLYNLIPDPKETTTWLCVFVRRCLKGKFKPKKEDGIGYWRRPHIARHSSTSDMLINLRPVRWPGCITRVGNIMK